MNGKDKCKILKDIRKEIAKNNNITLVIEECTHKGDCSGTCPRCESEVRYLEKELDRRRKAGLAVAVAGLALPTMLTGCCFGGVPNPFDPDSMEDATTVIEKPLQRLDGEVAIEPEPEPDELDGDVAMIDEGNEEETPYDEEIPDALLCLSKEPTKSMC